MAKAKVGETVLDTINKICIDFHGVLTNGKINISSDGKTQYEAVHVRDVAAIRELIARGYEVYIVTSSSSPIIDAYCKKVGAVKVQSRVKDNLFKAKSYIAVGDSAFDLNFLKAAAYGFYPIDAELVVKNCDELFELPSRGGEGCVADILEFVKFVQ